MRDLLTEPLWRPQDLGQPIPDSPHATSVCLPCWADNLAYEAGEEAVISVLQAGYPRFVLHPTVQALFDWCTAHYAAAGEVCLALPSRRTAAACGAFAGAAEARIVDLGCNGVHAVCLPASLAPRARQFWQHSGELVSSRRAAATLAQRDVAPQPELGAILQARLATEAGAEPDDVYLYPSGMAAAFEIHRALLAIRPGLASAQFGFPYVDSLKILEKFGAPVHFFATADDDDLTALQELLQSVQLAAVFCEMPGNPNLRSPNLEALADLAREFAFPLVVDDTIATFANLRLLPPADILWSSLTKHVSGAGDVMGGSVILRRDGQFYAQLSSYFQRHHEPLLFAEDVACLEGNSRDFVARVRQINQTTEALCSWLRQQPEIERVYYPKYETPACYERWLRPGGGYGGLFSLILRDQEQQAPRFFDALEITKGPSLGTNFSLACPYTILAHYQELEFARKCGISPYLVRVSIGLESIADLRSRFARALQSLPA